MIGQIVQPVKDNLPHATTGVGWHNLSMKEPKYRRAMTPSEFEAEFVARTQALRKTKFNSAKEMALALGIPQERYAKYETRTPMPHALIEPFALIVGVPVAYLITGRKVDNKPRDPGAMTGTNN